MTGGNADKVSLRVLAGYSSVSIPLATVGLPLVIYVTPFYAGEIGLPLAVIGAMLFIARISDVITDPLVGFLSDRTRTRLGRRTIWMLCGAVVMVVGTLALFIPPASAGIWYLLIWVGVVYAGFTMVGIPYESLSAELSPDYHQRTRINGGRQIGNLTGLIVATTIPAIILSTTDSSGAVLEAMAYAFVVLIVIAMTVFVSTVREPAQVTTTEHIGLTSGLKIIAGNKPFVRLSLLMFIANLGESFRITITWFFADDIVGVGNIGMLYVYYFATAMLSVPVWVRLAGTLGKHRALFTAFLITAVSSFLMFFIEKGDVLVFTLLFSVKGFCFGSFQLLPQAMTADIVDIDHLHSGKQRQGAYFSIGHMLLKFASAFGQGLSLLLLGAAGYQAAGANTESGLFWLQTFYCLVPVAFFVVAAWIVWGYPLTAEAHERIRERIARRDADLEGKTLTLARHPETETG